ncbi:MAG: S9 family peptidase [Acidimicrobiales bacterium]
MSTASPTPPAPAPRGAEPADLRPPVAEPADLRPPVAERRPVTRDLWGEKVVDDLAWLRDRDDEAVVAHLEAENAYTEAVLAPVAELRQRLYQEIKGRIRETDLSVPVTVDGWAYYTRTEEGLSYPRHCRRWLGDDPVEVLDPDDPPQGAGPEEVVLDENVEAGDDDFFDVGPFDVSNDHTLLFWGWDRTGDERFTATVRDLRTGRDLDERLEDVSTSSAWSSDGRTLFYVRPDEANRPYQVWRHRLGTSQDDDVCVFTEPDERFFVGVGLEKDKSYIQIGASSKVTDEVLVIPADDPEAEPRLVAGRRQGVEYSVAHRHDRFVILTNDRGAENFKVVTAPDDDPGPERWEDLEGLADPSIMISDIDVDADHLVLFERAAGQTRLRVRRWDDGAVTEIEQREVPSTVWPGANPSFETTTLRYGYSSMVTPPSVYLADLVTGERRLLKQQEVLGDFDPARYRTDRLWVTAPDGAGVPVSIVWAADRPAGPGPCLLYAYGAYEASMDPMFSAARLSLLDRGFAFAIAHVRGGGEMGRAWYLDGKFEQKSNTFDDVVAVARHLVDEGWTTPDLQVLRGGSAGGLMVGAVINRAPELFTAAVAQVAFVDVLNTMLDATLPLTVTEWEEWGDPAASAATYRSMRAYAPYENVADRPYPSVLATGGLHDTRVGYWEPAKWVQVLRRHTTSGRPILLWTELGAGHGGPSGRYEAWREEARLLAYILWAVGLDT